MLSIQNVLLFIEHMTKTDQKIEKLEKEQRRLGREVGEMRRKLRIVGGPSKLEALMKKGREFARNKGITKKQVLEDD